MTTVRGMLSLATLALLAGCAPMTVALPDHPMAVGKAVTIEAKAVLLNPQAPDQSKVGNFTYAGGIALTSAETSRLHGLSDIAVYGHNQFVAVGDEGDLVRASLVLDKQGRLVGVGPASLTPLSDLKGSPLQGKRESDSEGLALLANGDLLVSFERDDRIWLYPARGGPPRVAPMPDATFPDNLGLEALGADPAAGPDAYVTGAESTGATWACQVSQACKSGPMIAKPADYGLVAVSRMGAGRTAWLIRAWDPIQGSRVSLIILGPAGEIDRLNLSRPLTVDNFEGIAAVPKAGGGTRFYLISDDNFASNQRTLLLAFDWMPPST